MHMGFPSAAMLGRVTLLRAFQCHAREGTSTLRGFRMPKHAGRADADDRLKLHSEPSLYNEP